GGADRAARASEGGTRCDAGGPGGGTRDGPETDRAPPGDGSTLARRRLSPVALGERPDLDRRAGGGGRGRDADPHRKTNRDAARAVQDRPRGARSRVGQAATDGRNGLEGTGAAARQARRPVDAGPTARRRRQAGEKVAITKHPPGARPWR